MTEQFKVSILCLRLPNGYRTLQAISKDNMKDQVKVSLLYIRLPNGYQILCANGNSCNSFQSTTVDRQPTVEPAGRASSARPSSVLGVQGVERQRQQTSAEDRQPEARAQPSRAELVHQRSAEKQEPAVPIQPSIAEVVHSRRKRKRHRPRKRMKEEKLTTENLPGDEPEDNSDVETSC